MRNADAGEQLDSLAFEDLVMDKWESGVMNLLLDKADDDVTVSDLQFISDYLQKCRNY